MVILKTEKYFGHYDRPFPHIKGGTLDYFLSAQTKIKGDRKRNNALEKTACKWKTKISEGLLHIMSFQLSFRSIKKL
jgi:hypothetical protein